MHSMRRKWGRGVLWFTVGYLFQEFPHWSWIKFDHICCHSIPVDTRLRANRVNCTSESWCPGRDATIWSVTMSGTFFPGSFIRWFRAFCFMPLLQCWWGCWGGCWVGVGVGGCSYIRRDQDKVVVIHTLGNLFPPSISTSVWSVNTPSFFSQTPS